jgi:hypothetical protein
VSQLRNAEAVALDSRLRPLPRRDLGPRVRRAGGLLGHNCMIRRGAPRIEQTFADAAPGSGNRTTESPRHYRPTRGTPAATTGFHPYRRVMPYRALLPSPGARAQLGIFLLAYLVYSAARYLTVGDLGVATANAHWILDLEHRLGVADEDEGVGVLPEHAHAPAGAGELAAFCEQIDDRH